jgi:hypothetical protein
MSLQQVYKEQHIMLLSKPFPFTNTPIPIIKLTPKSLSYSVKMFTTVASLSLLFASTILLRSTTAFPTFTDSTVAYLTNCQTSDTHADYSEVSIYSDVTQSFAGQNPDTYADTSLGAWTAWEGNSVTWSYNGLDTMQADSLDEFINANAQDPSIPTFSQVGCATYTQGFSDGAAIATRWNCYKDNPRVLYTTSDHECSTVYYCRVAPIGQACPFSPPGEL